MKADIARIVRLRINSDGNGVRSVIFFQGCPLNCVWCCNPETRTGRNYRTLNIHELYGYIAKDTHYFTESFGGVTFSGGEPLLYADYICEFANTYCKNFTVNAETSLYSDRAEVEKLVPIINEWYTDFKIFDEREHVRLTGVSNDIIKENFKYLSQSIPKEKIIVTYPLVPGFNISDRNLYDMMSFLSDLGIYKIELHPYRKESEKKHIRAGMTPISAPKVSGELLRAVRENFEANGFEIQRHDNVFGKDKCRYLKNIRKELCRKHGLCVDIADCTVDAPCIGTCPRCEYELTKIHELLDGNQC